MLTLFIIQCNNIINDGSPEVCTVYEPYTGSTFEIYRSLLEKLYIQKIVNVKGLQISEQQGTKRVVMSWKVPSGQSRHTAIFTVGPYLLYVDGGGREYVKTVEEICQDNISWFANIDTSFQTRLQKTGKFTYTMEESIVDFTRKAITKSNNILKFSFNPEKENIYNQMYAKFQAKARLIGLNCTFKHAILGNETILTGYKSSTTNVVIPNLYTVIQSHALEDQPFDSLHLNSNLKMIGTKAFNYAGLYNITIPSNVSVIMLNPFGLVTNELPDMHGDWRIGQKLIVHIDGMSNKLIFFGDSHSTADRVLYKNEVIMRG